ncbi:MAG: DNA-binding protein [Lachnospiraceae bacterium]|nr:DNA-binding protein [Lachnospiraceae bacterium]
MESKISQGNLYDFYGEMLNEHQREVYEDFVLNDLSLGEIASDRGISRQAVHDLVKRATKQLEEYEAKLHLIEKFVNVRGKIKQINNLCELDDGEDYKKAMDEIKDIANDILEEL